MNDSIFYFCDPSALGAMAVTMISHSKNPLDFYYSSSSNILYITSKNISRDMDKSMTVDWRIHAKNE